VLVSLPKLYLMITDVPTCPALLNPTGISSASSSGNIDFITSSDPPLADTTKDEYVSLTITPVAVIDLNVVGLQSQVTGLDGLLKNRTPCLRRYDRRSVFMLTNKLDSHHTRSLQLGTEEEALLPLGGCRARVFDDGTDRPQLQNLITLLQ
jgi:hypothetical protein